MVGGAREEFSRAFLLIRTYMRPQATLIDKVRPFFLAVFLVVPYDEKSHLHAVVRNIFRNRYDNLLYSREKTYVLYKFVLDLCKLAGLLIARIGKGSE